MSNEANPMPGAAPGARHNPMPRTALLGVAGVVAVVAIGASVIPRVKQNRELVAETKTDAAAARQIEVISPHFASDSDIVLPGNIQAVTDTPIYARASGYIVKLYVDIGSKVEVGQVLAQIESPEVQLQLQQAQADTSKSQATVVQSLSDVEKLKAGYSQAQAGAVKASADTTQSQALVSQAQSRLAQAKANKAVAVAKLAEARQGLEGQKSSLQQSQAQLDLAATTAKRYRSLLQEGFIAQQDDDQAQATLKTARAIFGTAQSAVKASAANVNSAEEAVNAAQAAVDAAASDVKSSQASLKATRASESAARSNVQAASATVNSGKFAVQANKAQVNSQLANQRKFAALSSFQVLRAPFKGIVTSRNVDVGSLVAAGGATGNTSPTANGSKAGLLGLAKTDELRIQVSVPQNSLKAVVPGTHATVTVNQLPGRKFIGTVATQSGALDSSTRTQLAEIRIKNADGTLLPGMFAQVTFAAMVGRKTVRVPASALSIGGDGTRVVVVRPDNTLHYVPVKLGRDFGPEAEALEGLKGDEKLVVNPSNDLAEGMKVKIAPPDKAKKGDKPGNSPGGGEGKAK